MSIPRENPCKFFNTRDGCRKGSRCPFEHARAGRGPSSSMGRGSGQKVERAPQGNCDFFWSTGFCKRAFECRFKHVLSPLAREKGKTTENSIEANSSLSANDPAPFLTISGLSDLTASADAFRNSSATYNPQETHGHILLFMRDNYRFTTAAQMCSFARLLLSASSTNKSWTDEDGQLFLVKMGSENGRLRLSDILSYEKLSVTHVYDATVLSFQRGYLPVFQFLSSKFVVKSTLSHDVNSLYAVFDSHIDRIVSNLDQCISALMIAKSFKDRPSSPETSGATVFGPLVVVFYEYLSRFKGALAEHRVLGTFVLKLSQWVNEWADAICSSIPTFGDLLTTAEQKHAKVFVTSHLKERISRVISIINREQAGIDRSSALRSSRDAAAVSEHDSTLLLQTLQNYYEGPGQERQKGPRHDNDFVDIQEIKIAPTDEELASRLMPFLPANIPNAPHPFPSNSMQRLLDIQFRLLREELLAPLRTSVQVLQDDMQSPASHKTQLSELKKKKGGRYNYQDRQDSVMFNVYTNIRFARIEMDTRRGLVIELQLDTPPGSARSKKSSVRAAYWSHGKRLMQGGLVAMLWKRRTCVDIHLGVLCSSSEKLAEAAKKNEETLQVRIQFFDTMVNFKILENMKSSKTDMPWEEKFLIESTVMFESIRPFLDSLKRVPESIPFGTYLPHPAGETLRGTVIQPPTYSTVPNFSIDLQCLRSTEGDARDIPRLLTTDPVSIAEARTTLTGRSRLDPSQAQAVVDTLTREVALIQGPPGTGKTFIGVELIRILVENKVGPILLIAFTNHALDHMLSSIVEASITTDIVRLGGRSADETIKRFSIEELERASGRSYLDRAMKSEYRTIKETEEEIKKLLTCVIEKHVPSSNLLRHISIPYPDHVDFLDEAPDWIRELHRIENSFADDANSLEWREAGKKKSQPASDTSLYAFWKAAKDLDFLRHARMQKGPQEGLSKSSNRYAELPDVTEGDDDERSSTSSDAQTTDSGNRDFDSERAKLRPELGEDITTSPSIVTSEVSEVEAFFLASGESEIPEEPVSNRPLEVLLESDSCDVWRYSASERARIDAHWVSDYRESAYQSQKERFASLIERHALLRERQRNRDEEIRLNIMRNRKLIGCTTTGAAKLISLLKGFSPRVMLVEEAGQVLESHVLASLVDSVEHLILIGDPFQLRPTLNNYGLSMDNPRGKELYRFDMSLMERLSSSGFPMTQLNVQRRMRPSISSLIRNTLYPGLKDHDIVTKYESVRGMAKDIFFLSHGNKEHGGGDDSVSKHNPYEVSMIKDLVKYLLRQGCYSADGSIVVLCAYLGQLAKVRDALKDEMTVVIDERNQDALDSYVGEIALDGEASIERVHITQRVRIRSVDNYQGEEADVVILSLVRNSGDGHETNEYDITTHRSNPRIGFLKSKNRTNVALSRARHGLYILGNASDFAAQSTMWSSIITQLEKDGAVGNAIPVKCHRHPENVRYISKPGDLPKFSPDGGCLISCNERLPCGHNCPYKCHSDDPNHRNVFCIQPCPKLCPKGHPCQKQCAEACGKCLHPICNVALTCGHIHDSVPCYQMDDLSEVVCKVKVKRDLPTCGHSILLPCSSDVKKHKCQALCDGKLPCCGKSCRAKCHACQDSLTDPAVLTITLRTRHRSHECGRPLYCEHLCQGTCTPDHKCLSECQEKCRQNCAHAQCKLVCSKPCSPCQEPCTWKCRHHSCPVPCGSVCARLPCDFRCTNLLSCGHQCPSVCGENCSDQICLECSPKDRLASIADFVMQRALSELEPSKGTIDELIITLPDCKHAFTVETLDGHCHLHEYYEQDAHGTSVRLKLPEPGYKLPPTCPTCRRAIRSPRYGRVYKRADLDILERNFASQMSRSLNAAVTEFNSLDQSEIRRQLSLVLYELSFSSPGSPDETQGASKEKARGKVLDKVDELPVAWTNLDPGKYLHGVQDDIAKRWKKEIRSLKTAYERAFSVASNRSAHLTAWESAFSSIYRQEIENAAQDPVTAPRDPIMYAMRMARMKIGQPKPLADKHFCVEAILLTLSIRSSLANLAQVWLKPGLRAHADFPTFKAVWSKYISFVLDSCERDAKIALGIAEASGSRKQTLRSRLLLLDIRLDSFKFELTLTPKANLVPARRDECLKRIRKEAADIDTVINQENIQHGKTRGFGMADADFRSLFLGPANLIKKEWTDLEDAIRNDSIYIPVSTEEKKQIVAALSTNVDFSHSGHFYQCPNGHTFVIGNCGGATVTARCPECFEPIGGSDHNLLSTNRRDIEMEELARANGAEESPWRWGR